MALLTPLAETLINSLPSEQVFYSLTLTYLQSSHLLIIQALSMLLKASSGIRDVEDHRQEGLFALRLLILRETESEVLYYFSFLTIVLSPGGWFGFATLKNFPTLTTSELRRHEAKLKRVATHAQAGLIGNYNIAVSP